MIHDIRFTLRLRFLVLLLTILTLIASAHTSGAQDLAELEIDHALTFDFFTPHTDWARPYALGKTRVLFFTDGTGTNPRECVELMQRFDIEAKAVFWAGIIDSDKSQWHGGELGEQRMDSLLEQKWDVFVFLGLPMDNLSHDRKETILKAVAKGGGIVFVGCEGPDFLRDAEHIAQPSHILTQGPSGDAYTVGKGRGISLPGRPEIGYYEGWEVDYDYWQEHLGRSVLWAAGKEPECQLHLSFSPAPLSTDTAKREFRVRLIGKPVGEKPVLHFSIRRPGDDPISWPAGEIGTENPLHFATRKLSEGSYHADARLVSSAGVETWATLPLEVQTDRRIAELKLDQSWGEPEGTIAGSVTLAGEPLSKEVLRIQLLDRNRRELVRRDLDLSANPHSARFEFEIAEWLPMLTTVEARLLSDGEEGSRAYQYFRVTKRRQDRFNFLVWDVPTGTLAPYAEESLARHGMTLQLGHGNPPEFVSAFNIPWVPYTTRILANKTPDGIMQPFCWNDEEAVRKHVSELASRYTGSREHGSFVYSLGDENITFGCCLSHHCGVAYRKYLEEIYGSLEALNRSWGSDFRAWYDVDLPSEGDSEEANTLRLKNHPRWFDHQAFSSWNYIKYCQKHREAFRAIDPQAKVGFEGAGGFAVGDDLDLIVRSLDFWAPYPGTADEVIRSIAPRDFIRSNWMGYTKDTRSLLQSYWHMVTLGMDSVWWWRWDAIGRFHGWLAPDLRPYPAVKEILEDSRFVRDGLGDLLLQSEMQHDGIAILFSYPSTFAHKLDEGASYEGYEEAHLAVIKLLRSMGLQFRYVTDRMLRMNQFDSPKYKILILPRSEAIGDREAEVIRDFAENGGTVIADVRPGLYDDHCKLREKGVLDSLFGVRRTTRTTSEFATIPVGSSTVTIRVDPSVKIEDAGAMLWADGIPLVVSRKVGRGKAILLNSEGNAITSLFSILEYVRDADVKHVAAASPNNPNSGDTTTKYDDESPHSPFCQRGNEGNFCEHWPPTVDRYLKLQGPDGGMPKDVEITRWRDGGIEIISLLRQTGPQAEMVVSLPAPRYLYDLRTRRSLGFSNRFIAKLVPNRASFFALTRRPVPTPSLTLESSSVPRGTVVRATLSLPDAEGLHALRMRVQTAGRDLEWYNRTYIVGQKPQQVEIPIAFNDPPGDYQMTVIDLFSDETREVTLKVVGAS